MKTASRPAATLTRHHHQSARPFAPVQPSTQPRKPKFLKGSQFFSLPASRIPPISPSLPASITPVFSKKREPIPAPSLTPCSTRKLLKPQPTTPPAHAVSPCSKANGREELTPISNIPEPLLRLPMTPRLFLGSLARAPLAPQRRHRRSLPSNTHALMNRLPKLWESLLHQPNARPLAISWKQMLVLLWIALAAAPLFAQSNACSGTPAWSSCDLTFDLAAGENAATADLRAEFRSPHHRTYLMSAFAEGSRLTIRFAPTEEGDWDYRLTSNVARLNQQTVKFTAASSDSPGFVKAANVHHFATERPELEGDQPHLWMGSAVDDFLKLPRADFDRTVAQRASEKFTHLRVTLEVDADLRGEPPTACARSTLAASWRIWCWPRFLTMLRFDEGTSRGLPRASPL